MSKNRTTAHLRTPFHYFQLTSRALTVPLLLPSRLHGERSPYYSFVVGALLTKYKSTACSVFMFLSTLLDSPIRIPACNGENLIPFVIIVSMCEVFSPERRCTRHALQKHYTNRQIFKKFLNNVVSEQYEMKKCS